MRRVFLMLAAVMTMMPFSVGAQQSEPRADGAGHVHDPGGG
jgi:hypothetical protein